MATALIGGLLCRIRPRAPCAALLENTSLFSYVHSREEASPAAAEDEASQPVRGDDLRSRLFRLRFPKRSATAALEKWVSEGREITASELRSISRDLKRAQRYKHALEISEWMKTHQEFELLESDYAMRIDLITKVFGVNSAEEFFEGLPSSAKTCDVYTALLHSYAAAKLTEKAENLFERIMESNFQSSVVTFNEMMTLYVSTGQLDKVSLVVEELKQRKVPPDLFTYNLQISASAAIMDIDGVRKILEEMAKDPNSNDGWITYMTLTDIYITASHLVNSNSSLVEVDKTISQREWIIYDFLIILYAGLGNRQRMGEIWKSLQMTSQKLISRNFICILSSYLLLGEMKEAGEVIDQWKESQSLDVSGCSKLFDAFMKAGCSETAEVLHELMQQKNCEL